MNTFKEFSIVILIVLLAVGCNSSDNTYNKSMEAFEFSQNCPNVCFLGIKPSVTTLTEAHQIFLTSPYIDRSTISILHNGGLNLTENPDASAILQMQEGDILQAIWLPTNNKDYGFYTHITATQDQVDSIDAQPVDITIQDFFDLIGEPDRIVVRGEMPPDAEYWISYSIFYSKWKLLLRVFIASIDGPQPDDKIYSIVLNPNIIETNWQSWNGFGKMKDYMTEEQLNDYYQYNPGALNIQP